jgi:hypothetical protein
VCVCRREFSNAAHHVDTGCAQPKNVRRVGQLENLPRVANLVEDASIVGSQIGHTLSVFEFIGTVACEVGIAERSKSFNRECFAGWSPAHQTERAPHGHRATLCEVSASKRRTCCRGHPLAGDNRRVRTDGRVQCLQCHRESARLGRRVERLTEVIVRHRVGCHACRDNAPCATLNALCARLTVRTQLLQAWRDLGSPVVPPPVVKA